MKKIRIPLARAFVSFEGVDIYSGKQPLCSMTDSDAVSLHASLSRQMKRIKKRIKRYDT